MEKVKLLILLLVCSIFLTGCENEIVKFETDSNGECTIECIELAESKFCMESISNYATTINNSKLIENSCECILLNCLN